MTTDPGLNLTDQERLVQGIIGSLHSALILVVEGREHHALCIRSFGMTEMYEKDWPLFYHERWPGYNDETKSHLKRWFELISVTAQSAAKEKDKNYETIVARSVIFLADVLENLTETFLQVCLHYIDDRVVPIKKVTGRRPRDMTSAAELRRSVRVWERSLKNPSRAGRFVEMITTFFSGFHMEAERLARLDQLMAARNAFTHELIVIAPKGAPSGTHQQPPPVSDADVQRFFDDVGEYIMALMAAFTSTVKDGLYRKQHGNPPS